MAMQPTTSPQYNAVAKTLHWLIAFAIIGMLILGWIMTDDSLPKNPARFAMFQWHKSIGITILVLSLFRLVWRLMHKAPPLPSGMKAWERWAAQGTHVLFYVLIIGMPLTGWVMTSTSTHPTVLYGLVPLPPLPFLGNLPNAHEIGKSFEDIHGILAYVIVGLLVLHILAGWKHHLINRDNVLLRMAPRFMQPLLLKIRGGQ